MKQIEATILGQSYVLACPPGGETLLLEAVNIVDREMSAIRDAGKVKARERMAVLAALNLAFQRAEQLHAPAPRAPAPASGLGAEADVERLIARIDQALGDDGHLL
ncbi:MAG: cell division protein ZapA [Burkholderiales bacterium]|nr:cell division protein ZapA [Burkholderiales bacterium]